MDIYKPDGVTMLTHASSITPVSGWCIRDMEPILTGNEFNDYILKSGNTSLATVQPWHGYFGVVAQSPNQIHPLLRQTRRGSNFMSYIKST